MNNFKSLAKEEIIMNPPEFYRKNSQRTPNEDKASTLERAKASTIGRSRGRSYTHMGGFVPLKIQKDHEEGVAKKKEASIEKLQDKLNKCTNKLVHLQEKLDREKLSSKKRKSYHTKSQELNARILKISEKIKELRGDISNSNKNIEFEKSRLSESGTARNALKNEPIATEPAEVQNKFRETLPSRGQSQNRQSSEIKYPEIIFEPPTQNFARDVNFPANPKQ